MDKLMDHPWFIRVVSLLLAIMLYMSANVGAKTGETRNTFGQEDTETLIDIPVVAYYDEDNLVVFWRPEIRERYAPRPGKHRQTDGSAAKFRGVCRFNGIAVRDIHGADQIQGHLGKAEGEYPAGFSESDDP